MIPWQLTALFAAINVALISALLYVYLRNLIKLRSGFTFGLLLFAALFWLHNAFALYFSITMMPLYAAGVGPYMLIFMALQTVAFGILNYVTWK